jgi:hypothetical protein
VRYRGHEITIILDDHAWYSRIDDSWRGRTYIGNFHKPREAWRAAKWDVDETISAEADKFIDDLFFCGLLDFALR